MSDVFISYSSQDKALANLIHLDLTRRGLSVFMSAISLQPGDRWAEAIYAELRKSRCVIFLASRTACSSAYVQQELGGAITTSKPIIPVVWELSPPELPGWISKYQSLDLRGLSMEEFQLSFIRIAERIKQSKRNNFFTGAAFLGGLLLLGSQSEEPEESEESEDSEDSEEFEDEG